MKIPKSPHVKLVFFNTPELPLKLSIGVIVIISSTINLLSLTAPLFMLQVYDRVLSSRSIPTLVGLSILAAGLFSFQAFLEIIRGRIFIRIGEVFEKRLAGSIHDIVVSSPLEGRLPGDGLQPIRDLENVRTFLAGHGPTAVFDLPWMPLYILLCFVFHYWVGVAAVCGATALLFLTILTHTLSTAQTRESVVLGAQRYALIEACRRNAEVVRAMGLISKMADRWGKANAQYLASNRGGADIYGTLSGISRSFRLMLQSGILAIGAWVVIQGEATAGVMIASSIMVGRALAPIDLAISNWKSFLTAWHSWSRLKSLLMHFQVPGEAIALPKPEKNLLIEEVTIIPPGERMPTVIDVGLSISAGTAVGIIGPSGSGKSTLARAIVGVWRPARGSIRIDGASLDQWSREALGPHIGYLPQGVELFDGTIAENIARFDPNLDTSKIIAAAKAATIHEQILRYRQGYETRLGEDGSSLSAGQRQRIGLARALYGNPFLVVLDEPNAHLDGEGETALMNAIASIRKRNGIAVVIAHRPNVLGVVDHVVMMEAGRIKAVGPRDQVMSAVQRLSDGVISGKAFSGSEQTISPFRAAANESTQQGKVGGSGEVSHEGNGAK